MGIPLRVLIVEDSPEDALLMVRELRRSDYDVTDERVETAEALQAALKRQAWDIVLSDYSLPDFDGLKALKLVQENDPDLPFILLSGDIGEEIASVILHSGAHDFIIKGHWARLLPAVERELAAAESRRKRHRAEEALRKSEAMSRAVLDHSPVGISVRDKSGVLLQVNEAWKKIWALSDTDIQENERWSVGRSWKERFPYLGDNTGDVERLFSPEGKLSILFLPEMEIKEPRPGAAHWISQYLYVLRDPGGQADKVVTLTQDITERKRLEAELLQAQKMEAIGTLAGGVAHDFNNILTAIMSYSELMLFDLDDGPLRHYAERIKESVGKAATLIQQLLAFSRKEVANPLVLKLNEVVADAGNILRRLIGEDIDLVIQMAPDAGCVKADPGQLEQVIMNLAVNARDAMPQGGKLTIQTANAVLDESNVRFQPNATPGRYVQLSVSDTGRGMDEATQARMYEPFFTTKEQGKGTGLGLSTVYGIILQSGGFIAAESAPGKGARFRVYLPRVEEEAVSNPKSPVNSKSPRGSETVLLVEDEPEILGLVNEILAGQGYTVLKAGTGDAALKLAERHTGPIHLLFTDVVMPGMSGRVLAERLTSLRPEVRVIYTSGYTDDAIFRHGLRTEGLNFLQKPFRPDALTNKVREVLDAP